MIINLVGPLGFADTIHWGLLAFGKQVHELYSITDSQWYLLFGITAIFDLFSVINILGSSLTARRAMNTVVQLAIFIGIHHYGSSIIPCLQFNFSTQIIVYATAQIRLPQGNTDGYLSGLMGLSCGNGVEDSDLAETLSQNAGLCAVDVLVFGILLR